MTFAPTAAATDASTAWDAPPPLEPETIRHCRGVLLNMVDMAHAVAQAMHLRVMAPPAPPQTGRAGDPVLAAAAAFDRASRNIRQTVMLVEDFGQGKHRRSRTRVAGRKRIIRDVEDAIQRSASGPRAERLYRELAERLELPDLEEELEHRQVAEIVTDLCRDLGVAHVEGTHPWKRRTPADIEALHARAARPAGRTAGGSFAAGPIRPGDGWAGDAQAGGAGDRPPPDRPPGAGAGGGVAADPESAGPLATDTGAADTGDADTGDAELSAAAARDVPDPDGRDPDVPGPNGPGPDGPGPDGPGPDDPGPDVPDPDGPDLDAAGPGVADFCAYEPGARAWFPRDRVTPDRAAIETTRPSGRASFRGG